MILRMRPKRLASLALLIMAASASAQTINNPGYETGSESGWLSGGSVHGVHSMNPRSGTYNLYNNGGWNSVFQTVSVSPNTTYTVRAWARLASASTGNNQSIYVNNGGTISRAFITSTTYTQYAVTFTTGASTTSVEIGSAEVNGTSSIAYVDDWTISTGSTTTPPPPPTTPPPPPPPSSGTGSISREVWSNVSGTAVSNIPLSSTPSSTGTLTSFEAPTNVGDNYGQRVRGYLTAPTTGSYTFWIASDDDSQLFISTNDQASGKAQIASVTGWTSSREWGKYASQKSAARNLTAGTRYYIEALMKEGGGGDNLAVGWSRPGQGTTAPSEVIPGSVLSPFSGGSTPPPPPPPPPSSGGDGLNARYFNNMTVSGTAALTRTDAQVNFAWTGSPGTGVNADGFSVRWMGELNPTTSGNHTFQVVADDGIRLWVNDQLLINQWKDQGPTTYTSSAVSLTAGTKVDINVDFYENSGGAEARLRWQTPGSTSFVAIPQANLFSTGGDNPPSVSTPPPPPPPPSSSKVVNKVRFYPRGDLAGRMVGGKFQGSNTNATSGFVDLHMINSTPAVAWNEVTLGNTTEYRYLRYYAPIGSYGNVAEVEFYNGATKLSGTGYGTAGSWNNSGNDYTKALDGNTGTFFDAASADDQYVGIDQGGSSTTPPPPPPPSGGSNRRVYHVGNSVTDTLRYGSFQTAVQSKSKSYTFGRHMIPGAPLSWIWDHPNDGFQESPYGHYGNALPNYTWDVVTLQPFDRSLEGPADSDRTMASNYINLTRQRGENANITRFIIMSRWPRKESDGSLNFDARWTQPYTASNHGEETRDFFQRLVTGLRTDYSSFSSRISLAPVGDVMYELNQRMKAGQVAGYNNIVQVYDDGIHLNNVGAYITAATFYAVIWKEAPTGLSYAPYQRDPNRASDQTITDSLAAAIQDAVWDVTYNHSYTSVP